MSRIDYILAKMRLSSVLGGIDQFRNIKTLRLKSKSLDDAAIDLDEWLLRYLWTRASKAEPCAQLDSLLRDPTYCVIVGISAKEFYVPNPTPTHVLEWSLPFPKHHIVFFQKSSPPVGFNITDVNLYINFQYTDRGSAKLIDIQRLV